MLPDLIPVHSRSVPVQFPFSVHLLPIEPVATDPSLQEKLHSVPYNISVLLVLHPTNIPLVGNDNIGQVTTKQNTKINYDASVNRGIGVNWMFSNALLNASKKFHVEVSKRY